MDALLGVSPLLRRLCGQLGNVKAVDLHHRSLNAAAAKSTNRLELWGGRFSGRYRQVSTLEFDVEVVLTACPQIMLMIFSPVTLIAPSSTPSKLALVSLQATGDIWEFFLYYFALAVEETSRQEQPRDDHEGVG
jgi:hypothetical protein